MKRPPMLAATLVVPAILAVATNAAPARERRPHWMDSGACEAGGLEENTREFCQTGPRLHRGFLRIERVALQPLNICGTTDELACLTAGGSGDTVTEPDKTVAEVRPEPNPPERPKNPAKPSSARAAMPDPLIAKAEALRREGRLLEHTTFLEQREKPVPSPVGLSEPSTRPLPAREIARLAREAYLRTGWFYHCTRCDHWHLKLAGGYAIAPEIIATAWHVMTPPSDFKEGSPVAVDHRQRVLPITEVLGADEKMDGIVLRVGVADLACLALCDTEVGDPAYCFSDPLQQRNYFSAGIVNRFYLAGDSGTKSVENAEPSAQRMNVSTDWGPGSSGAAVLDGCGNIIGHVGSISPLFEKMPVNRTASGSGNVATEDRFHGAPLMTLHEAIPARSLRTLIRPAP